MGGTSLMLGTAGLWRLNRRRHPLHGDAQQKPMAKGAPAGKPAMKGPPRGPVEKYDCKIGTEDQHARIAILAQGGEVQSVAYYSKWKPRTCSVHLQRNDAFSKWKDTGDATVINTEYGDFLIQVSRGEYQLFFREVDRMHYCGMMGKLNGAMSHHGGKNAKFAELEYSANAVGVCDAAVEMAMHHAKTETRGGRPLAAQQVVQLQLSEMHMMTEALRSFMLRVATESDDEENEHFAHSHFLMNFATKAIQRVCELNQDIHGYADGRQRAGADKLVRDAKIWTHIAGDAVQKMKAVSFLLK